MDLEIEYQKKEHIQHIYDLPDTYTGSVDHIEQDVFVLDDEKKQFICEKINYVPGLFKIFDEILVNALDHKQRDPEMKNIKVQFSTGLGAISVWNDGRGIDVEKHPIYGDYIVEMLFGQLLTSSNYDKNRKRIVGGKNGYGAKLTNIFSTSFCIETVDAVRKKKYTQTFTENMRQKTEPVITECSGRPYTCVTFTPDYQKFGCAEGLTRDIFRLFERRVYDLAACMATNGDPVCVFLNREKCRIRGFEKYISLYNPSFPKYTDLSQDRWKVGVCLSYPGQGYQEMSFVNGIWTQKGGRHSEHVCSLLIDRLKEGLCKHPRLRGRMLKNASIKEHLFLFLSCVIENPSFTSQTKEEMCSKVSDFGSKWHPCDRMIEKIIRGGELLDRLAEGAAEAEERSLKKSDGNKKSTVFVPKLEDANFAGTRRSLECTLILTEGDSAKASALAGLSVHGPSFRDFYGVFPLKGKFLNVREASTAQILGNEEVKSLKKILGLQQGKEYTKENLKELRYGSVSLMTDQDSVTGDTPVLISLSPNQKPGIFNYTLKYIQDLFDVSKSFLMQNGKQICYLSDPIYVWTSQGYTLIRKVIRHKTKKRIFRVITRRGMVDVSEDHSLLNAERQKISPKEIFETNSFHHVQLLHSLPKSQLSDSFEDVHFQGQQRHSKIFYEYSKFNAQFRYLSEHFKGNRVTCSFDAHGQCFIVISQRQPINKPNEEKQCIDKKTIPSTKIMDDSNDHTNAGSYGPLRSSPRKESRSPVKKCIDISHLSLDSDEDYSDEFCDSDEDDFKIIQIIDLGDTYDGQFIYDLETENHEFQAGIGELIVHNTDGSHIKGLIINFFDHFFPSLLKIDGFLKSFITPIVRGFRDSTEPLNFYTLQDYANYRQTVEGSRGYTFKYYKGLGTSSSQEMQEYFRHMENITVRFEYTHPESGSDIELAFRKSLANQRKKWLQMYDPSDTIAYKSCGSGESISHSISISDFVHKDLKHFSNADNIRSVPSLYDGFKPSQRKVLYGSLKKCAALGSGSVKVAQLSGYISEQTSYHHGEASLEQTIVSMAQKFVGKNNVNWLEPLGMFGTRLMGGRDHASSRYIFTRVSPLTLKTFRSEDSSLLEYETEDGDLIEPKLYYPVVPTILLNGSEGIGTGYSTFIPCFNPLQIVAECEGYIRGAVVSDDWVPWYDGFTGRIVKVLTNSQQDGEVPKLFSSSGGIDGCQAANPASFVTLGNITVCQETGRIIVTELPVGLWTDVFKDFLEEQIRLYREHVDVRKGKSGLTGLADVAASGPTTATFRAPLTGFVNRSTEVSIYFEVYYDTASERSGFTPPHSLTAELAQTTLSATDLLWLYRLKLLTRLSISNMYLYVDNELRKFGSIRDIVCCFAEHRLQKYAERKEQLLSMLQQDLRYVRERRRFLESVESGSLPIFKRDRSEVEQLMEKNAFLQKNGSYDYCTKMPIDSFTKDKMKSLDEEIEKLLSHIDSLLSQTPGDLWLQDLLEWKATYEVGITERRAESEKNNVHKKGDIHNKARLKKRV